MYWFMAIILSISAGVIGYFWGVTDHGAGCTRSCHQARAERGGL